ncbi:MAG: hypothetical protein WCL14_05385 [Bacteroidota bacterium]
MPGVFLLGSFTQRAQRISKRCLFGCGEKALPFRRSHVTCQKLERATCRQNIAPIVAAARCFVSAMGMQRLQRIAGLAMIRVEDVGSLNEL